MVWTRRYCIGMLAGVIATFAGARKSNGQSHACVGRVTDSNSTGVKASIDMIEEVSGRVTKRETDDQGNYSIAAPAKGQYSLIFYKTGTSTQLADVRQLTGGTPQNVSVTVKTNPSTFAGTYSALSGWETIGVTFVAFPTDAQRTAALGQLTMDPRLALSQIETSLEQIEITDSLKRFLREKAANVRLLFPRSVS